MRRKKKCFLEPVYSVVYALITYIFTYSAFIFFVFICRGKIENEEKIERNLRGGFIIASNHVSYLDSLVLYAYFHFRYRIRLLIVAKNKMLKHPLWNLIAKGARVVRVSDCGTRIMSLKEFRRLAEAKYIGIFPEATRSATGELITPHGGAIKLAARNNIPLIPLRLEGFYEAWPRERKWPKPHPCRIVIGTECRFDRAQVTQADEDALARCILKILHTLKPAEIEVKERAIPLKPPIPALKKSAKAKAIPTKWKIVHDGSK